MKTKNPTKVIGAALFTLAVSGSHAFAQTKNSLALAEEESSNHLTLALSVLLFLIGFAILFILKKRDDKKHELEDHQSSNRPHIIHRNHYGHNHQYHH